MRVRSWRQRAIIVNIQHSVIIELMLIITRAMLWRNSGCHELTIAAGWSQYARKCHRVFLRLQPTRAALAALDGVFSAWFRSRLMFPGLHCVIMLLGANVAIKHTKMSRSRLKAEQREPTARN